MKKTILLSIVAFMLLFGQNVSAQDFFITDVNSEYGLALTADGYVLQAANPAGNEKNVIKEGAAAITALRNVFLMNDGSIDKDGKIITGLDVKKLIADRYYEEYYIDNSNRLHNSFDKDGKAIMENVAEAQVLSGILYIKNTSGDLYFVGNGYNADKNLQFLASDVCGYSDLYYLKNNGDLYYFNPKNNMSSLIMRDVDIWQGISSSSSSYTAAVYQNGMFKIFEYGKCVAEYAAPHGVNDMQEWGYDILYIGKDKRLYFLDAHSYYGYFKTGTEREFCLSDNLLFERLYGKFALDINNNLYAVVQENYTTSSGNNYTGIYENLNIYLGNPIADAVPNKIDYYNRYLIATQNGVCYTYSLNTDGNFLYNTFNNKNINLQVNKQTVKLSSPIQVADGRTMYPLRDCFTAMGASVQWDAEKQIAAGEIPGIKIEFPIGKNEYYINGVRHEMDTAAYVDESIGRTYIPVRYAAEGLGFTVEWVTGNLENTIDIHK